MTRSTAERLQDVLDRIAAIQTAEQVLGEARFRGDDASVRVAMDAILYDLVVIGEAVRAVPAEILEQEPAVPWRLIVGMRNRLAHEYFRLRPELVGLTIDAPITQLREACQRLLEG